MYPRCFWGQVPRSGRVKRRKTSSKGTLDVLLFSFLFIVQVCPPSIVFANFGIPEIVEQLLPEQPRNQKEILLGLLVNNRETTRFGQELMDLYFQDPRLASQYLQRLLGQMSYVWPVGNKPWIPDGVYPPRRAGMTKQKISQSGLANVFDGSVLSESPPIFDRDLGPAGIPSLATCGPQGKSSGRRFSDRRMVTGGVGGRPPPEADPPLAEKGGTPRGPRSETADRGLRTKSLSENGDFSRASSSKPGILAQAWETASAIIYRTAETAAGVILGNLACAVPKDDAKTAYKGAENDSTCNASNCHPKLNIEGHSDFGNPDQLTPISGSHPAHISKIPCARCHDTYDNNHLNGQLDSEGLVFNGIQAGEWNDQNQTCTNTTCHTTGFWGQKNPYCAMCHNDSTGPGPNPVTGKHTKHTAKFSCSECHSQYTVSSPNHRNGTINSGESLIRFDMTNPDASYLDDTQTCANLTCHGKGSWKNAAPDCIMCHNGTTGPGPNPITGSHTPHTTKFDCSKCHNAYQDLPEHRNGTINSGGSLVRFDAANPNGSYGDQSKICSNLTCHNTGQWGNTNPACVMCHNATTGPGPNPATGSHPPHTAKYDCLTCHDNYPSAATHRDGTLNSGETLIKFNSENPSGSYEASDKSCQNLSCHQTGHWGDTNPACVMCHNSVAGPGPNPITGSHPTHTGRYDCSKCHNAYPAAPIHRNGIINSEGLISFDATNPNGSYDESASRCQNLYCHGPEPSNVNPTWGTSVSCGDCHSVPPTTASHPKHTGNDFSDPQNPKYNFDCGECHANGGPSGPNHINGNIDVSLRTDAQAQATGYGQNNGNSPSYSPETNQCFNVYCHSNGVSKEKGGAYGEANIGLPPNGAPSYNTPTWDSGVVCGDCHPAKPLSQITSDQDYPASGKHRALQHLFDWIGWPQSQGFTQCFLCHGGDTNRQGTYGTNQHNNGILNFHPYRASEGGTVWDEAGRSYQDGHCGNNCHEWYP